MFDPIPDDFLEVLPKKLTVDEVEKSIKLQKFLTWWIRELQEASKFN